MNKKTITLKLDATSKIILLILGAGVWFMALKALGPTPALASAEDAHKDVGLTLVKSDITRGLDKINRTLISLEGAVEKIDGTLKIYGR